VLNYTLPESPETYIHRTGRTGRAGKRGVAISLISPREIGTYYILRRVYKMVLAERELPTAEEFALLKRRRNIDQTLAQIGAIEIDEDNFWLADKILGLDDARDYVARLLSNVEEVEEVQQDASVVDEKVWRARPAG